MTLRGLMRHLAQLDLERVAETALAAQAEAIAAAAREAGADGGEVRAAKGEALVGWRSVALRRRERGDLSVRPRPVLAPVAVAQGGRAAEAVGAGAAGFMA